MIYRKLTEKEINQLKSQACAAEDWNQIGVAEGFSPEYVHHTRFSGEVRLGRFQSEFLLPGGVRRHSGLRHVTLHHVTVGDNCCIERIGNYIANYEIGHDTLIVNTACIFTEGVSRFGNGVEVSVLNETGGCKVPIYDELSAHPAYILACYGHCPQLLERLKAMIASYADRQADSMGRIGPHVQIVNAGLIKNVRIGAGCRISGILRLTNGSIHSKEEAPVTMGEGVICEDFIVSSGSKIEGGVMLTRCFVGQACQLRCHYSASDSLFFSNFQGENGEARALFAGPFTVTHHKSTLLIAGMLSFMNAGSGSNQSNHNYKLGPIHHGTLERGVKTASDSYVLWPARVGAFSLVVGRHNNHPDTSDLPFSYLIAENGTTCVVPGANLRSIGTFRDARKWFERDGRTEGDSLDFIHCEPFTPYTMQRLFNGLDRMRGLCRTFAEDSPGVYSFRRAQISRSALVNGIHLYEIALHIYLGNALIRRLDGIDFEREEEIGNRLKPTASVGRGNWVDIAGLIAPESELDALLEAIESGRMDSLQRVQAAFEGMYRSYAAYEWTWICRMFEKFYGVRLQEASPTVVIRLVEQWKEAVTELDEMRCTDAQKEHLSTYEMLFTPNDNDSEQGLDANRAADEFKKNPVVAALLEQTREKLRKGDALIERMKRIVFSAR